MHAIRAVSVVLFRAIYIDVITLSNLSSLEQKENSHEAASPPEPAPSHARRAASQAPPCPPRALQQHLRAQQ